MLTMEKGFQFRNKGYSKSTHWKLQLQKLFFHPCEAYWSSSKTWSFLVSWNLIRFRDIKCPIAYFEICTVTLIQLREKFSAETTWVILLSAKWCCYLVMYYSYIIKYLRRVLQAINKKLREEFKYHRHSKDRVGKQSLRRIWRSSKY